MSGIGSVLVSIANANIDVQNAYLNALDLNFRATENSISQVHTITLLLSRNKTRHFGLRFLIKFLRKCPENAFVQKVTLWLTTTIKCCNLTEIASYGELIFESLARLLIKIKNIPDVSKWFASTCLLKFYGTLRLLKKQTTVSCTSAALNALKQCIKQYPGPSKSGKPIIVEYLLTLIDHSDSDVIYQCGECWLLLQQVRGFSDHLRGFNEKTEWLDYQMGLLDSVHSLLHDSFPSLYNELVLPQGNKKFEFFTITLVGDPIVRSAQAFRRLCNLIEYFKIALCQPYPSTKLIRPMPILEFIQRGLELSYVDAANNTNLDDLCLGIFLPQIHVKLLELLEMLIDICQTHLRMNFRMITNILVETLKRTRKSSLGATHIHLLNLRSKVYKVFLLWISVIREGSGCEQIVECLVKEIMEDVKIKRKDGHTVSVSKQKDTAGNKRKQNNNAKVETSQKKETELYLDKVIVCTEALRCLQAILISSSYLLKPHVLKETYLTIFEVCASNYEKRISLDNMYNKSECRLEMYRALFTLTKLRNLCHPPCTELILYLLDAACTKDSCSIIRTSCKIMLSTSELVIHPHKENFAFKTKLQNTLTEHPHLNAMLPNPIHSEEMRKCQNMFTSSILSKDDEQKYTQNSGDNQNNGIRIITKNISLQNDQITVEDEFVATKNTVIDTKIPVYTCSKHTKNELKRKDNIIIQQTFPVLIGVEKPIEREAKINQEDNECIDELQGMFVDELK